MADLGVFRQTCMAAMERGAITCMKSSTPSFSSAPLSFATLDAVFPPKMNFLGTPQFGIYVQKLLDRHHVPGLAISILHGEEIDSAGFGKASLQLSQDCTPDTLFDIASSSKSLTAAAVAVLVNNNEKYPLVQWETPVASLLPEDFVMPGTEHGDVTVEDILSHRTGMPA